MLFFRNIVGRYIAWDWLRANWDRVLSYYPTAISSSMSRIIQSVSQDFNTKFELASLQEFIEKNKDDLGAANRTAEKAVQSCKANIRWMDNHYKTVIDWLQPRIKKS